MNNNTICDPSTQNGQKTIPIIDEPEPQTCFCPLCLGCPDEPTPEEMAEYDAWREQLYELTPEEIAKEKQEEEEARKQGMLEHEAESTGELEQLRASHSSEPWSPDDRALEHGLIDRIEMAAMERLGLMRPCVSYC